MAFKAFVSSTFEDLKEHRAYVITTLRRAGLFVDPMEDWTAASEQPKTFSQTRVKGCDLCVLLVAFRRGHVPEGEKLSITQLEYQAALLEGLDVLVFLLDEKAPWPRQFDELIRDEELAVWRSDLMERKGVSFFGLDPTSIEIAPALARWLTDRVKAQANETMPKTLDTYRTPYNPDEELWRIIRNSESMEDFETFLQDFPKGKFAKIAETRLIQLRRARRDVNSKISFFLNSCRELGFRKGPDCEQCGNKVFIELPEHLQKLLDEIDIPPRNKLILHANGGTECAFYKRRETIAAVLPDLSEEECEYVTTTLYR